MDTLKRIANQRKWLTIGSFGFAAIGFILASILCLKGAVFNALLDGFNALVFLGLGALTVVAYLSVQNQRVDLAFKIGKFTTVLGIVVLALDVILALSAVRGWAPTSTGTVFYALFLMFFVGLNTGTTMLAR